MTAQGKDDRERRKGGVVAVRAQRQVRRRPAPAGSSVEPRSDGFLNRELSWLDFDRRVLELASDPGLPLLERVKLCGIVSSNLDEFFAVRMAGLQQQVAAGMSRRGPDGYTPTQTLKAARARCLDLKSGQEALWLGELRPLLASEGIRIAAAGELAAREQRVLAKRFARFVQPLLTPIAVGAAAPFPYVPSLALSIGAIVRDEGGRGRRFVRVNVPDALPRFVDLGHGVRIALEDAILNVLPDLVGGEEIEARGVFRITRNAHYSVSDDVDDLLDAIEAQLRRRRFGDIVRLEVDSDAPAELVDILTQVLEIGGEQVYLSGAPLGLRALTELTTFDRPDLKDAPWRPVTRRPFAKQKPAELLAQIRRRDILVHHPYDSFESSVQAFVNAAGDPKVAALKATVYRTDDTSPTLAALVKTAEEDKQAVCLVELKARFEERRNIEWSRELERAGVDVVFGAADLKVHAKLALIIRHERDGLRRFVHIGTGNYHASNASNYEDFSLFTADEEITADVADLFNAVTGGARPAVFRKLLVGPWFLREGILDEIDRVTRAAQAGETTRIRIKVNALVDPEVVDALYLASAAGVRVDIVARGICVLRPGVPGLSEGITVRSVLGRFLEHSRIYSFETGDRITTWIGSADAMPRNLDRRIEVLAPVEDSRLRAEIAATLDALEQDTRYAWQLGADGIWSRLEPAPGAKPVSAQETLMARATKRAKKNR